MIEKVKVISIYINSQKKDGTRYQDKNGNPFELASLKYEGGSASMILGKFSAKDKPVISAWKAGDEVSVVLQQNSEYTNFSLPGRMDMLEARIEKLEKVLENAQKANKENIKK
jgi:hypothetical protein